MKKILITGGSGFIGTNFIKLIIRENVKILNIDKISSISTPEKFKKLPKKKYIFQKKNLINLKDTKKILNDFRPNIIINFAAESHVDRSINDPIYFIKNNIISSTNLFHAFSELKKNLNIMFYHISTDEVYGSIKKGSFKEYDKYKPSSPYSASKASIDLIAESFNSTFNTDIKILNLTNNYGPYQYPEKFIPTLIFHFLNNKPAPIYGNGKNIREWIHVNDSCKAIWSVVKSKKKIDRINIGSNYRISNIDLAKKVFKIMKSKKLTNLDKNNYLKVVKDRPGHDVRYALNTNKFKRIIGFKTNKTIDIGLQETIEWYTQNNNWLKSILKSYSFKRLGLID